MNKSKERLVKILRELKYISTLDDKAKAKKLSLASALLKKSG